MNKERETPHTKNGGEENKEEKGTLPYLFN